MTADSERTDHEKKNRDSKAHERAQIAAAQLRLTLDQKRGIKTEPWIVELAKRERPW